MCKFYRLITKINNHYTTTPIYVFPFPFNSRLVKSQITVLSAMSLCTLYNTMYIKRKTDLNSQNIARLPPGTPHLDS